MLGELVAIKMTDEGESIRVTGYTAGLKNRQRMWTFAAKKADKAVIPEMVENMEKDRKAKNKE